MTQEIIEPGKAYTTTQAGFYLGYTENYIRRLIKAGRIIATKPTGGQLRITGEEVQRILAGVEWEGRVPPHPTDQSADEIIVTEEQAARIFGGKPRTAGDPPMPPTEDEEGTSIYDLMRRKYGE